MEYSSVFITQTIAIFFYVFVVNICSVSTQGINVHIPEEAFLEMPELVEQYNGYTAKKHTIKTRDGYLLSIFQIYGTKRDPEKLPILAAHGIGSSSEDYVRMGPKRSIAFLLADEGYDVWLGNFRGNLYTSHEKLKKTDVKFWDFSLDEIGKYDAPAMMEYILNKTKAPKIHYIGFSMGTTIYFITCNRRPDLASKTASYIALAPVVTMGSRMKQIGNLVLNLNIPGMLRRMEIDPVMLPKILQDLRGSMLCTSRDSTDGICYPLALPSVDEDLDQIDWVKRSTTFAKTQPASVRQLEHFCQIAVAEGLKEYDWGKRDNLKKYGYPTAKSYNVTANIAPTVLYYGDKDDLTEPEAMDKLAVTMKTVNPIVIRKRMPYRKFNHIHFMYARDVDKLINDDIVRMLNKISKVIRRRENEQSSL